MWAVSKDLKTRMISIQACARTKIRDSCVLVTVSATGVPGYNSSDGCGDFCLVPSTYGSYVQEAVHSVDTTAEDYVKEGTQEMTGARRCV